MGKVLFGALGSINYFDPHGVPLSSVLFIPVSQTKTSRNTERLSDLVEKTQFKRGRARILLLAPEFMRLATYVIFLLPFLFPSNNFLIAEFLNYIHVCTAQNQVCLLVSAYWILPTGK